MPIIVVYIGAVYSARRPDGLNVAIKVINLNSEKMNIEKIAAIYLNEVSLLERLRRESRHVVLIHDFDFDPQTGLGFSNRFRCFV
jgi:hypothetical protein